MDYGPVIDSEFRKRVSENVVAGLIVALVVAGIGLAYSLINDLSAAEFAAYVLLPATGIGLIVCMVMVIRAGEDVIDAAGSWMRRTENDLIATKKRLAAAEGRIDSQLSRVAYADVIVEAESEGWTVSDGERGVLDFAHAKYGTAATGGRDETFDPEKLRLILQMGR